MPAPLSNRRRKAIAALTQRRARRRQNQTLVEGRRALDAALRAGAPIVDCVVTEEALTDPTVKQLLNRVEAPVYRTDPNTMGALTDVDTPQGLVATVERRLAESADVSDILGATGTALLLDGVQDPGNVGTLLRTAAWFGVDVVGADADTAGLYGPKVMRAAAGAHWSIQLTRTHSLASLLDRLEQEGCSLYGADLQGVRSDEWRPVTPSVLVLGSEAHGLSPAVLDRIHTPVAVAGAPGRPAAESLNVAVAGGILLYEWCGPDPV